MIYRFLINKTKILTILAFAVIFSVLTMFLSTKVYAAPNNQGLGWAMSIGKQSTSTCYPDDGRSEIVKVILTSSEDHSARPTANIRLQSVASTSLIVTDSNVNTLQIPCIDPYSGVWVQVWGNSSYLRWDNSFAGERYNWGMGFASGTPSSDRGKIVTYYIFLVPNGSAASIEAIAPQPDNTVIVIPDMATTTNVTFQVKATRQLPSAGGGNYIKEVLTYLHKKDGGNLPGCSSSTCFWEVDGSWSFGSTISFSIANLPIGSYEWYSQLMEDNRTYCPYTCLSNTYPITGQFANQNFTIQTENGPPPPPPPGKGSLTVWVFNDINGNGVQDTGEQTLVPNDAPGTTVLRGGESGWTMSQVDTRIEYSSTNLTPGNYEVTLILPDTNWQVTKYSSESLPDTSRPVGAYRDNLDRSYTTVHIPVNSGYNSWFKLGVQKPNLPNLTADTPVIYNAAPGDSIAPKDPTSVSVQGYINNIGVAKDLQNIGVGFYLNDGTIDQTNLRNITRAATTTTNLTTSTTKNLVSSAVSVVGLSYGSHKLWICADYPQTITESNETDNCASTTFTLAEAPEQWLKTEKGDVGVRGSITMVHPDGDNADYLAILQGANNTLFTSAKNWLVKSYQPLDVYPSEASGGFGSLLNLYSKKGIQTILGSGGNLFFADVANKLPDGGIGEYKGNVDIEQEGNIQWTGKPTVIFIDGNLTFGAGLDVNSNTGLVFIVSGNITINSAVTQVDGVFISYGKFNTTSYTTSCGVPLTETHSQLQIHGAVYSFGSTCFTRNLGKAKNADPAELITYEPKYLVLFRETLGETVTSFKEVIP
jgi:hypothetical protein